MAKQNYQKKKKKTPSPNKSQDPLNRFQKGSQKIKSFHKLPFNPVQSIISIFFYQKETQENREKILYHLARGSCNWEVHV